MDYNARQFAECMKQFKGLGNRTHEGQCRLTNMPSPGIDEAARAIAVGQQRVQDSSREGRGGCFSDNDPVGEVRVGSMSGQISSAQTPAF